MKPLITGGLGVNGAVTARLMVKDGLRPVLMDNRMDLTLMGDIKDQVDIVIGDICDKDALEKAVGQHGVTHIAHLAALMPEPAEADPRLAIRVGAEGTINVLEVARAKNIKRVVFTSSKAAYGEISGEYAPPECKPVREDHAKEPADLYGSIKVCCEELGPLLSRDLWHRVHRAALCVDLRPGQGSAPRAAVVLRSIDREGAKRREMGYPAGRRSAQ